MATKTKTEHSALYRTYRPQSFKEVRGQEHIVSVLQAGVKNKKISHAYLFAGTRGTGKTSVARIFARELGVSDKDLYEMDAASNRGIDDIRELREGVYAMPFESPYKVYIIDEAHMLTKDAFNALLKTLEEPPSHAIFILATTERHKVLDTIQSRCETYSFKQPTRALLAETVTAIAKEEGYKLEQSAADLVALLAEGSFRDAIGILQKVLTVSKDKTVNVDEVEQVTGAPTSSTLDTILEAIAAKDIDAALQALEQSAGENMDARILAKLLIHRMRAVLLVRLAPDTSRDLEQEFPEETFKSITKLAKEQNSNITERTLLQLLEAHARIGHAAIPYLPLELALIASCKSESEEGE